MTLSEDKGHGKNVDKKSFVLTLPIARLVKTVFMLKPLEALLPSELDGKTYNRRHRDIANYRMKWSRGRFSENSFGFKTY